MTGSGSVTDSGAGRQGDPGHLLLLVTSPRVASGLLSWPAWQALRQADRVLAAEPDPGRDAALDGSGVMVEVVDPEQAEPAALAAHLLRAAAGRRVVWWGSPDGDPELNGAVAGQLSGLGPAGPSGGGTAGPAPVVEVLVGAHDLPGARLLDLVAVMDRLRSPGGCPWDAEQTSASLRPYLLEEAFELLEALDAGEPAAVREELGDVLLQVVFHARLAEEDPAAGFDIDDVAAGIVAKLVSRHPHVFPVPRPGDGRHPAPGPGVAVASAADVEQRWDQLKAREKNRASVLDGVPAALPALARAQKVLARVERAGMALPLPDPGTAGERSQGVSGRDAGWLGQELLRLVDSGRRAGIAAEDALREAVRRLEQGARDTEAAARADSAAPSSDPPRPRTPAGGAR